MSQIRNRWVSGIEPIVAAVLLIIVAVVGSVLLYLWFSGYITRTASQVETVANPEKLKVEAVQFDTTNNNKTIVYVRNVGDVPVNITSAYVVDIYGNVQCSNTTVNIKLVPGNITTATITNCNNLIAGEQYFVKVVTERGTEAGSSFRVPA